jgi:hypothetical protein
VHLRNSRNAAPKRTAAGRGGHGKCAVCSHEKREQIDLALRAEVPLQQLAKKWGMSTAALSRHNAKHVSASLVKVHRASTAGLPFVKRMERLVRRMEVFVDAAEQGGKPAQFIAGMRELRGLVEAIGRATGEMATPELAINMQTTKEWVELRSTVLQFIPPESHRELAQRLKALSEGRSI